MNVVAPFPRDPLGRAVLGTVNGIPDIAHQLSNGDLWDLAHALRAALVAVTDVGVRQAQQDAVAASLSYPGGDAA